jgi:integrase
MVKLSDSSIKALRKRGRFYTVPDDGMPGLEIYVTKGGAKTFSVRYTLADGTRRRMNLGRWPAMSLADAHEAALVAMGKVAKARDPAQERKRALDTARAREIRTMDDLAEALFEAGDVPAAEDGARAKRRKQRGGVRPSTAAYRRWLWTKHLKPRFGDFRPEDMSPGAVRRVIREIGSNAGPTTANRALSLLKRVLNFGVAEEHIATNPIAKVVELFDEESRARVLTDEELKALWQVAESTKSPARKGSGDRGKLAVSRAMAVAVLVCAFTIQRGNEVAGMRRGELDLEARTWLLPAERCKSKREHLIPLSDTVVSLLKEALRYADLRLAALKPRTEVTRRPQPSDPVFPSPRAPSKPVVRLSLGRAMARMIAAAGIDNASPHDLRRTGATLMASERIGTLGEVVARVLNHAPPGQKVTAIYNRHAYVGEKRRALEAWEGLLLEIVGEREPADNVRRLRPPT